MHSRRSINDFEWIMPQNKKIAIPVETKVRELDAKLWLSLHLAKEGSRVRLGQNNEIMHFVEVHDPDIFLGIGPVYRQRREKLFQNLEKAGRSIVLLETEGGAFKDDSSYFEQSYSDEVLQYVDQYFAWGKKSSELAKKHSVLSDQTNILTGNPRFDLLHSSSRGFYREKAVDIKDEHGPFVLINTNFGAFNSFQSGPLTDKNVDEMTDREQFEQRLLNHLLQFAQDLQGQMPDVNIVIRPHPGENHNTYRDRCSSLSNVSVIHKGDVRHWILASEVLIHNNCTTGIEGVLMEQPVLAYTPESHPVCTHLSNKVSYRVPDRAELMSAVDDCVKGNPDAYLPDHDQKNVIKEYISNTDGKAAERIVQSINHLDSNETSSTIDPLDDTLKETIRRTICYTFGYSYVDVLKKLYHFASDRKADQKFPGVRVEELLDKRKKFIEAGFDVQDILIRPVPGFSNVFQLEKE